MDAKRCDRCGQFYISPVMLTVVDKTNVNLLYLKKWIRDSYHDETLDLCADCKHDLDEWFDKFKKEEQNDECEEM